MTEPCTSPVLLEDLFSYRRGELDAEREQSLEDHYFSCSSCAEMLAWLEALEASVAGAIRRGLVDVVVNRGFVERLERAGAVLRRYDLLPGDSVQCTSAPGEHMTIVTLRTPLRSNVPVTLVFDSVDAASGERAHRERLVFQDPSNGEVVLALPGDAMRALGHVEITLRVRYGDGADAELSAPIQLSHSPFRE